MNAKTNRHFQNLKNCIDGGDLSADDVRTTMPMGGVSWDSNLGFKFLEVWRSMCGLPARMNEHMVASCAMGGPLRTMGQMLLWSFTACLLRAQLLACWFGTWRFSAQAFALREVACGPCGPNCVCE